MRLRNGRLILPDRLERGSLTLRDGRIAGADRRERAASGNTFDLRGGYLAPGFIDLHIHGGVGRDTMEASADAFRAITEFHLRGGTTSMTLTTVTAPAAEILSVLRAVLPLKDR
jgi:N-acetylglucosamine-6-phosphate deacetylase